MLKFINSLKEKKKLRALLPLLIVMLVTVAALGAVVTQLILRTGTQAPVSKMEADFVPLGEAGDAVFTDSGILNIQWLSGTAPSVISGDNKESLEMTPANNADQIATMQLNFRLPDGQTAAPGEIEIRVPRNIFETRTGAVTGTSTLNLATTQAGDTGFYYRIDSATNEIVIMNFKTITFSDQFGVQISYNYIPYNVATAIMPILT